MDHNLTDHSAEQFSKLKFPGKLAPTYASGKEFLLMGVGLRTVTIFGIHAYAAGVYFEPGSLEELKYGDEPSNFPFIIRIGSLIVRSM